MKLNSEAYLRAQVIIAEHVPEGPNGWQHCVKCGQTLKTINGDYPVWPCDARRLADVVYDVLRTPTFAQKREKPKRAKNDF